MESVYKNMQPCPNQKDQMYYRPYYYPGMEAIPPQMHMNSARPPMGYGWWPWGGNYGGAPPNACHSCCNHSYLPAQCAWGSPYAHVPQHPCPGNYPSFPVQYMPPPPFYGMGQPRYEYEKNNVPREHHCCGCSNHPPREHHCCGCSNHPFYDKDQNSVRIEEEEPERERRSFDSLVPFRSKNSPDPVVWIPPDYSGKKEQGREGSHDAKAQHPAFWNGWRPLDLNSLESTKNRGDVEENNQHGDGNRDFPFPLFWIPHKPEDKEGEKYKMKDGNTTQSLEGEQNVNLNRENNGDQAAVKLRDIPVKEVSQHVEKKTSTNQEIERNDGEKKVDKGTSRKSPSPPKSSKLPPVCLRVDPLPRKKNGNGSSQPNDARKALKSSENKEQAKILHTELNKDKGAKTVKVVDGRISHGDNTDVKVEAPVKSRDDILTNQAEEKPRKGQISQNNAENDAVVKSQSEDAGSTRSKNEGVREKKLSEEEAAVIIQSAYRGFDVRKWEFIKKLKQIAKVREQMADVEHLIQAMKSSSDIQGRSKQRNVVAETIMSLLLKLDTIQGMHPSIRAARKSVVKELVSLQEQLDSLMNEQHENSPGQELIIDASNKSGDVVSSQNGNETNPTHQNQIEGGSNHESSEISEADLIREAAIEKVEKEAAEGFWNNGVESASIPTIEKDEKSNVVLENENLVLGQGSELFSQQNHDSAMSAPEPTIEEDKKSGHEDPVLDHGSELLSLQNDDSAKATDESTKLPIGVLDDFSAEEGSKDEAVEADASKADQAKQLDEALIESSESHETAEDRDRNQTVETQEVSDPPFNRVDVELATEETCPIKGPLDHKPDDNLRSEEELDSRNADVRIEPDECAARQPAEASEGIENCSCNKDNTELTPQGGVTEINDSEVASEQDQPQASEGHTEQGSFKENVVDPTLQNDSPARDEVTERNRILYEENERLREMMERLIKSGQEQLTAISSLSGRVKDLEKKLSRKKKLKLKQHKPPKTNLHA